jgi:hypothetical protein
VANKTHHKLEQGDRHEEHRGVLLLMLGTIVAALYRDTAKPA